MEDIQKCIYLREINTLKDLREITKEWVSYYNSDRLYQSLEYRTPNEVYYGTVESKFKINILWSKIWGTLQSTSSGTTKLECFFIHLLFYLL